MRKTALIVALATCAFGQASRDGYRNAYRAWREADPNLERDAATGSSIASRADHAASQAAKYDAERKAYLERFATEFEGKLTPLTIPIATAPGPWNQAAAAYLAEESKLVRRSMATFTGDPDAGLQRLRAMLDRENASLNAVTGAASRDRKAADAASAATNAADQARQKALQIYREMDASMHQNAQRASTQSTAWADYYRALAETAPPPATTIPSTAPSVVAPNPAPLPLIRYTGAWTFPVNGLYHGLAPKTIDLLIIEEGGRAEGTLFARFKLPPGSADDPEVRFDFSGDFRDTRNQVFAIGDSAGDKGTIELIPGTAFNLLEINFQMGPKPGKIR
ncbi:MAG: hypothetical protein ACRD30_01550, partial [Bryobacteraceae bacterium]